MVTSQRTQDKHFTIGSGICRYCALHTISQDKGRVRQETTHPSLLKELVGKSCFAGVNRRMKHTHLSSFPAELSWEANDCRGMWIDAMMYFHTNAQCVKTRQLLAILPHLLKFIQCEL